MEPQFDSSEIREKIILALDVSTRGEALELVRELGSVVGAFKIGLQLFTAEGPSLVREIVDAGNRVFLDLKFHDIPNTVAKASIEVAKLGVWMFNVHVSGGSEMMRATADSVGDFCTRSGIVKPRIIGVTVLTSTDDATLPEIGHGENSKALTLRYAKLAKESGLNGIVCSAVDVASVRERYQSSDLEIVTPGIRPVFATNDDQKRVAEPSAAVRNGSDFLVIGRPIIEAENRVDAALRIIREIQS
ncbi:MAG: orotidine-5'-phosphate decarboxylase [Pyrinomonadaceae bacterium]